MATPQDIKQIVTKSSFLMSQEQAICEQIAKREAPHGQRASALLALNEGNTQGQAAAKTGLTTGQIKYWAAKFRKERLGIFPDNLLGKLNTKADAEVATETENVAASKASAKEVKSAKTKSKGVKAEKEKKSKKKGKKSEMKTDKKKKGKKDKKDKKTKKKNQGNKKGNKSK